ITVLPQPNIAWFSDSILCNQALPVITNPNTFGVDYTLLYNFNSSVFDTVNPWTIDTAGLYFLVAENSCDTIVSRAFLSPQQIIEKELLESITLCPGEEVVLDAFWEGSSYVWSENVDGALISDSAIVVSAPLNHQSGSLSDQTGTELYTITITNPPCVRTLSTTVIFLSEDSCGNACAFSVPNVFTPNQDGVNDAFKISNSCGSQSFRFSIYNRWGTLIHSGTESIAYWDGTSNGAFVNSGVYFVIIEYTDSAGQEKTVKIAVSVLR
ncbi:MAG: gliding motility-associated C-terminal domain-containing protein, partial [Salibacteraceae bacterium]|nr:gliding motility-associated C-terminal domain-containing protein [Salibacteraceae bacterium]